MFCLQVPRWPKAQAASMCDATMMHCSIAIHFFCPFSISCMCVCARCTKSFVRGPALLSLDLF